MKIGYYLAGSRRGLKSGGLTPYTYRLVEFLLKSLTDVDFHLFIDPSQQSEVEHLIKLNPQRLVTWSPIHVIPGMGLLNRSITRLSLAENKRWLKATARLINGLEWQTLGKAVDMIHCPIQVMPTASWRKPLIITMHDVQELHFPEYFTPRERAERAQYFWLGLNEATKIVVSYQHVKDDLIRFFHLQPEKIHVCPIPIDNSWLPQPNSQSVDNVRQKYQISEPFILYPAQTWQHKNHIGLIKSLAYLRDHLGTQPPLTIFTGKKNDFYSTIEKEISCNGLQERVRFLGIVPEEDLVALYKTCMFVVIPTLYEAGSFPLYEAMMLNAPVICARTTSLPEIIDEAAFTFDPRDPIDIACLIKQMLNDAAFRCKNLEHCRQRINQLISQQNESTAAFRQLYIDSKTRSHVKL